MTSKHIGGIDMNKLGTNDFTGFKFMNMETGDVIAEGKSVSAKVEPDNASFKFTKNAKEYTGYLTSEMIEKDFEWYGFIMGRKDYNYLRLKNKLHQYEEIINKIEFSRGSGKHLHVSDIWLMYLSVIVALNAI